MAWLVDILGSAFVRIWLVGILGIGFDQFRRHSAVLVAHFGRILERVHGERGGDFCIVEGRGEG